MHTLIQETLGCVLLYPALWIAHTVVPQHPQRDAHDGDDEEDRAEDDGGVKGSTEDLDEGGEGHPVSYTHLTLPTILLV